MLRAFINASQAGKGVGVGKGVENRGVNPSRSPWSAAARSNSAAV